MKRIAFIILGVFLNAYNLKIFNIPNNTIIKIDKKTYNPTNKLMLNLKEGTHQIKIINPNFKPIKNNFDISDNKETVIILNKTKNYILHPYKTYFKNIIIKYNGHLYKCDENNIKCIAQVDGKNFYEKYPLSSNIYQLSDKNNYNDFYIKVKAPYFYSESTDTDALKDEIIKLEPIPNWSKIGFYLLRFSYINLKDFTQEGNDKLTVNDYKHLKHETYSWNFMLNYKKNLPYINLFFYADIGWLLGGNNSDNNNEETELSGPVFSVGIGKSLFQSFDITAGIKKISLSYKIKYTFYDTEVPKEGTKFKYSKVQPFIQIEFKSFNITISKNVYSVGFGYIHKF